jgi:hypothetical protein
MPTFVNNLFTQCGAAITAIDPFDCTIYNNILQACGFAVPGQEGGSLSREVRYNCFFNNQTNFVGYPPVYGRCDETNANGTPADAFMNICADPQFEATTNYTLSASSPCIDAGNPAMSHNDICRPPSKGTTLNDIGPYGGPGACDWSIQCSPVVIARAPVSATSCIDKTGQGKPVAFAVTATGTAPLSYQWRFHGPTTNGAPTAISGATNAVFTIANPQTNNTGFYSVQVGNACGTVTSEPVQLLVFDPCVDICMYAGITIDGQPGAAYVLKYTTDTKLEFSAWTTITNITLGSSNWFYLDMESCGSPQRYYGVQRQP